MQTGSILSKDQVLKEDLILEHRITTYNAQDTMTGQRRENEEFFFFFFFFFIEVGLIYNVVLISSVQR